MSRILLIRPPHITPAAAVTVRTASLPLGLAYIAAALRASGHEVQVLDTVALGINQHWAYGNASIGTGLSDEEIMAQINDQYDIIGISCMFATDWKHSKNLTQAISRKCNAVIVLGGEQVSTVPEHSLRSSNADIVVIGEGEETIVEIANSLDAHSDLSAILGTCFFDKKNDKVIQNDRRKRIKKVDEISTPAWDLFPMDPYLTGGGSTAWGKRKMAIAFSRGCPYQCTFCTSPNFWGTSWIPRNIDLIIQEIKDNIKKYNVNHFEVYDLTAIVNKTWSVQLAKRIIDEKLNVTWSIPSGTRSELLDEEMLSLLKQSGLNWFAYAPESGSNNTLRRIKKRVNKPNMLRSMSICNKLGIYANANMILGFPGETHLDAWKTLFFCVQLAWNGVRDINLAIYSPYPGADIYKEIVAMKNKTPAEVEEIWSQAIDTNYFNVQSYSEHISNRALSIYIFTAIGLFYGAQYIVRPIRIYEFFRNVFFKNPQTILEAFIHRKIKPVQQVQLNNSIKNN